MKTLYLLILLILTIPLSAQDKKEVKKTEIEIIQEKIAKDPKNPELQFQLGKEYVNKGDFTLAVKLLENAKELYGKDVPYTLYNNLAWVYYYQGDFNESLNTLKLLIYIQSKTSGSDELQIANSYNNIGVVYKANREYDKAIEYFIKSLEICIRLIGEEHTNIANIYNNIGTVYQAKGEYDKAIEYYEKSLRINLELLGSNHLNIANSYNNIGTVYQAKGEYDKAFVYYEKLLLINLTLLGEEHPNIADYYNNIATVYQAKGEYDKAFLYYEKSLSIYLRNFGKSDPKFISALNNMATIKQIKGEYKKALTLYRESLANNLKLYGEYHPETAKAYYNIGAMYLTNGEYEQAKDNLENSLALNKKNGNRIYEALCENKLGEIYFTNGKYEISKKHFDSSLKMFQMIGDLIGELNALKNIGNYYSVMGNKEDAVKVLESAEKIAKKLMPEKSTILIEIQANKFHLESDFENAEKKYQEAIKVNINSKEKTELLWIYKSLSELYLEKKSPEKALEYASKARDRATALNLKSTLAEVSLYFGKAYFFKNEFSKAIEELKNALMVSKQYTIPAITWQTYKILGDIEFAKGNQKESIENYKKSIESLRSIFSLLDNKNKFGYMQDKLQVYERIIQIFRNQKRNLEAMEYLEESRLFIMREMLIYQDLASDDLQTRSIIQDLKKEKKAIENIEKKSEKIQDAEQEETLNREIIQRYETFNKKFYEIRYSNDGEKIYNTLNLKIENTSSYSETLLENSILLQYVLLDEELIIFWVTKDDVGVVSSQNVGRKQIGDLVYAFRNEVTNTNTLVTKDSGKEYLKKLYSYLFAPLENEFKKNKAFASLTKNNGKINLIVIPYGILYFFPFESLS